MLLFLSISIYFYLFLSISIYFYLFLYIHLYLILLHMQVLNDKILSVRSIFAHVELKHLDDRFIFVQNNRIETDLVSDKILELIGGYLSQTFESGNLYASHENLDRRIPFLFGITVFGPFFIPYPE